MELTFKAVALLAMLINVGDWLVRRGDLLAPPRGGFAFLVWAYLAVVGISALLWLLQLPSGATLLNWTNPLFFMAWSVVSIRCRHTHRVSSVLTSTAQHGAVAEDRPQAGDRG